jgi:hypothetical protein
MQAFSGLGRLRDAVRVHTHCSGVTLNLCNVLENGVHTLFGLQSVLYVMA